MTKHLTALIAFLIMIGSQVSSEGVCEAVTGSIDIVTDLDATKDSLVAMEQQSQSGDLRAQGSLIDFESRHGLGSIVAIMTNNYEEWLAEKDCGTVDMLRPRWAGFDKQRLIELCLRHLPEITLGRGESRIVRVSQSNIFLRYDSTGTCRSYRYD